MYFMQKNRIQHTLNPIFLFAGNIKIYFDTAPFLLYIEKTPLVANLMEFFCYFLKKHLISFFIKLKNTFIAFMSSLKEVLSLEVK